MTTQHTDYLKATCAAYNYLAHALMYMPSKEYDLAHIWISSALDELRIATAFAQSASEPEQYVLQELKGIRDDIAELRKAPGFQPAVRIVNDLGSRTLSEVAYIDALGVRVPVGDGFTVGVVVPGEARSRLMQKEFLDAAANEGVFARVDGYTRLVELVNGCTVRFLSGPYTVHRMGGMDFSHIVGDLSSLTAEEREFVASRIRLVPPPANGTAEFLREAVKRKPSLDLSGLAGKMGGAA